MYMYICFVGINEKEEREKIVDVHVTGTCTMHVCIHLNNVISDCPQIFSFYGQKIFTNFTSC